MYWLGLSSGVKNRHPCRFFTLEVLPAAKLHYCLETAASMPPCPAINKYSCKASWQSSSGDSTAVAFIYARFDVAFCESTPTSP
jgi:hypothetical protein